MNFDIKEDYNEEEEKETKKSKLSIIIIVVVALVVGLLVFLICNSIFNPKQKEKKDDVVTSEELSLNEKNVKILYQYVTYGTTGIRNDKFVKEDKVNIKSFTDEEKMYYALQFAEVEDFAFTGKYDENKNKIYSISNRKIKKYIERFFGDNVKYSNVLEFTHPFTFSINEQNIGIMKYNENELSYDTIFKGISTDDKYIVEPYLGKLVKAYREADGSYRLEEKIIYVDVKKQNDDKYEINISKDYNHENVIESSIDKTEKDLSNITIDNYIKKASTITYIFKLNGNVLYFDSSSISK